MDQTMLISEQNGCCDSCHMLTVNTNTRAGVRVPVLCASGIAARHGLNIAPRRDATRRHT